MPRTYYVSTTGNDGGDGSLFAPFLTVAKAQSVAIGGDTINVGAGTFPQANVQTNLSGTGGHGVNLMGAGQTLTILTYTLNSAISNQACVKPGTFSEISNLKIFGLNTDGTSQCPLGAMNGDTPYANAWVHDAVIQADSDGSHDGSSGACSVLLERVTLITKFDAVTVEPGDIKELRSCIINIAGPSSVGVSSPVRGVNVSTVGRAIIKDSTITLTNGSNGTGPVIGVNAGFGATATVINTHIATSTAGIGGANDLVQTVTASLFVDPTTVFSTHSGTLTPLPASFTQHNHTVGIGWRLGGIYSGFTPTAVLIATHVTFDNSITLNSFAAVAGSWAALIPTHTPVGTYSVRITDGNHTYDIGTVIVSASPMLVSSLTMLAEDRLRVTYDPATVAKEPIHFTSDGFNVNANGLSVPIVRAEPSQDGQGDLILGTPVFSNFSPNLSYDPAQGKVADLFGNATPAIVNATVDVSSLKPLVTPNPELLFPTLLRGQSLPNALTLNLPGNFQPIYISGVPPFVGWVIQGYPATDGAVLMLKISADKGVSSSYAPIMMTDPEGLLTTEPSFSQGVVSSFFVSTFALSNLQIVSSAPMTLTLLSTFLISLATQP